MDDKNDHDVVDNVYDGGGGGGGGGGDGDDGDDDDDDDDDQNNADDDGNDNDGYVTNIFLRIKRIFLVRKNYFVKFRKNHITCPEQSQVLSKSTYSPSLLYNPRASLVGFPSSSSLNFSFAMLSNNLDK